MDINVPVPIVGLPFVAHECHVFVTLTCRCHPQNAPIVIRGIDQAQVCGRCKNVYAITKVQFEAGKNQRVVASVSLVGKHRAASVS